MEHFDSTKLPQQPLLAVRSLRLIGATLISMLLLTSTGVSQPYSNPTAVNLLTAVNFRILAGSAVTIGSTCTVTGDVGVSPGISVTNNGTVTGATHLNDAAAIQAQSDLITAYNDAAGRTVDATVATELGSTTLGRGVYNSADGTFEITGTLTLSGTASDVFIFKMATTLTTGSSSSVTLTGGALASNVFWQVGSSATIDGDFKGNILALTAITQSTGTSSIDGRVLARNSFITLGGTSVLPVEFMAFSATANRMSADIRWSTATEVNNFGFEVERRQSAQWDRVGFVAGAGTSSSPREYSYTDRNLTPGRYAYRIKQVDKDGTFLYHGGAEVEVGLAAKDFTLEANFPNPFNPSTTLQFTVAGDGPTSLRVHNILGQTVMTLFEGIAQAGRLYQMKFDASRFPSGLYFAKLESAKHHMMRKMVLMK